MTDNLSDNLSDNRRAQLKHLMAQALVRELHPEYAAHVAAKCTHAIEPVVVEWIDDAFTLGYETGSGT